MSNNRDRQRLEGCLQSFLSSYFLNNIFLNFFYDVSIQWLLLLALLTLPLILVLPILLRILLLLAIKRPILYWALNCVQCLAHWQSSIQQRWNEPVPSYIRNTGRGRWWWVCPPHKRQVSRILYPTTMRLWEHLEIETCPVNPNSHLNNRNIQK